MFIKREIFDYLDYVLSRSNGDIEKQPPKRVLTKKCSENTQQIYRGTPMPKCDFNKITLQLY